MKSSTFSSDFTAMKTLVESIHGLRYKLRMFSVPIDGLTKVLCDNEKVVHNSFKLESTLNKKRVSIVYHTTRWAVAVGVILVVWIPTNFNLADALSKCLPASKCDFYMENVLTSGLHIPKE